MKLKIQNVYGVISPETIAALEGEMMSCNELLHTGKGAGNDFLGWVNLPSSISETDLTEIETAAKTLSKKAEVVVVIGIGGSYLGAKAVIDSLSNNFDWLQKERTNPVIIFAGQNLSEDYMAELMATLQGREIATIVISKSGTTTEPAIAFRVIREAIEQRYGKKEAAQRIVAITDRSRGALRTLATQQGYKTFVIEDNVG
ncbi:MAG: glucose-6-phosphate isomerase, partial [Mucinivorans sp.]